MQILVKNVAIKSIRYPVLLLQDLKKKELLRGYVGCGVAMSGCGVAMGLVPRVRIPPGTTSLVQPRKIQEQEINDADFSQRSSRRVSPHHG